MAENQLILNEQNFISLPDNQEESDIQNGSTDLKDDSISENLNLSSELSLIDDMMNDMKDSEVEQTSKPEELIEKNTTNMSEETISESPSTGENYIYKCVFCDQLLTANDDPKLLECLHNACGNCISNRLYEQSENGSKGIECIACGLTCDAEKIIDNQFLLELTNAEDNSSKVAELKCSSCNDDIVATSWCVDCAEFICDICVQAHQRLKITKEHTIKPKEEGIQENQTLTSSFCMNTLFCATHPHEKLSLFCENCDKLTCRDCQLTEHRDHKYKFTHEIASDARKFIAAMLKDISYKRVLLNSAMKVIADRQTLITDKKKALVNEITQLVVKLTNTINVRGKQLVTRLTEVCDSKQKTLQEKKIALDQLSKMTDHCIEFTQYALDNGSDMALLFSKKQVTNHLQRIKCKRADIPNPEIPVRIHLALDKVPDLIKVISTIGQIVVDGRVYPSQPSSPSASMTPQSSPSPGHQQQINSHLQLQQKQPPPPLHSPHQQHQSQLAQQLQHQPSIQHQKQPSQQMHAGYQPSRMLPPYGQQYGQNLGMNMNQNLQQNMGQKLPRIVGNMPALPPSIPISIAQQLQQNISGHMLQRSPIRPLLPISRPPINSQQQQVSSSTHPQGIIHDRSNLRGLLQPNGSAVYVQTGPGQYQAIQPQYAQQFQNRFPSPPQYRSQNQQLRILHPGQQHPSQLHPNQQHSNQQLRIPLQRQVHSFQSPPLQQQGLKWHIPQQNDSVMGSNAINNNTNNALNQPYVNDNFKITLKSQSQNDPKNYPSTVTSTIPKTPSPNHIQGKSETENRLDKYCADSVKDLMATIAKLDSNGVQVLAENRPKTGGSPHVDSSTGDNIAGSSNKLKSEALETSKDDPNEDWCAVCMDGGELVCCDKCPKVFHQFCHIPNLSIEENDTWQCLLCMNFADIPDNILSERKEGELSLKEKKIAERLVLELYCQYEPSLPFREVISSDNVEYHSIIKKPIALDTVRQKLDWNSPDCCYKNLEQLVRDIRRMFQNAYVYNAMDNPVYNDARTLEKFFDEQLEKWLPEYAYETFEDDDLHPPNKKYKRIISL